MKKLTKVLGVGLIASLALFGTVACNPEPQDCEPIIIEKNVTVEVPGETIIEEKIVIVPVNVTVTEYVEDEERIESFKESLEERGIIEDAEEIEEIIVAEDEAIKKAFDYLDENEDELFDMLEDEEIVSDEDDVKIIKKYKDFEDIVIIDSDFDNEEYEFEIKMKIEDTDEEEKKYILVTVSIEDDEVEIKEVREE